MNRSFALVLARDAERIIECCARSLIVVKEPPDVRKLFGAPAVFLALRELEPSQGLNRLLLQNAIGCHAMLAGTGSKLAGLFPPTTSVKL